MGTRRGIGGLTRTAVLAGAASIGVGGYLALDRNADRTGSETPWPASNGEDEATLTALLEPPVDALDAPPPAVASGSLRETFLTTEEANRSHIIWLAIRDRGYDCPTVTSSGPVGTTATIWRASCEGNGVFWATIDEFDRLTIEPAIYGDIYPGQTLPRTPAVEELIDRTPQIDDPE